MKSIFTRSSLLIMAMGLPLVPVPATASPDAIGSPKTYPAPVLMPVTGDVNKENVLSETPAGPLSKLPARPTREQLEETRMEGLILVPVSESVGKNGDDEQELAAVLKSYVARQNPDDSSALESYITKNPSGPWTAGLRITCGVRLYHQGRFSEALDYFEKAWEGLKDSESAEIRKASVSAAAELAGLYARLGRMEELRTLLNEVEGRPVSGVNTEKIRMAAEGLGAMTTTPGHSFKCGPYALRNIREALDLQPASHPCIDNKESTVNGISLGELQSMAGEMDMDWVAAERTSGAELPLPVLAHWKVGHYAAVLKKTDDGRLLVRDPTFLHDFLVTPEVLAQESSGRFLVPRAALGNGWNELSGKDAAAVFGKGAPTSKEADDAPPPCPKCSGMAVYDFDLFKAGLLIMDKPLWYNPPFGPAIEFQLNYRQRSEQVLDSSSYGFGPKWTSNWSSYLQQADGAGNMVVFLPGGGRETHTLNTTTSQFDRQKRGLGKLVKTSSSPIIYELQNADGSKSVFSRAVATSGYPKYLLTSMADPQGNTVTLTYNSSNRLTSVKDALNQTSNFYYENSSFPHLVTKISDPFIPSGGSRRSALFSYDSTGRLTKITDPAGIESSFTYDSVQTDFINSMTTPYGTTTFVTNPTTSGLTQHLEVTDPLGRKERVEYRASFEDFGVPYSEPNTELPDTDLIAIKNRYLYYGTTLQWDKKTYALHPPDPVTGLNYDKAVRHKWMWHSSINYRPIGVIASIKKPFENRIWYEYPNQTETTYGIRIGGSEQPFKIGRRIQTSPAQTQVDQYEYNDLGNVTQHTDPLGRIRKWGYDSTGMDVLTVKQQNGTNEETLVTMTYELSDPPRHPRTVTDASGQTVTYSWNTRGQIGGVTQPGSLTTSWNYSPSGYLNSLDGPLAGTSDATSYTYDLYGRVRTATSPGAHTVTYDYDHLDRPTVVTYPDSTTEKFAYQRQDGGNILELTRHKDRENRWTLFSYNALRERVSMTDPLNRTTTFNWCYCGALQDLYDAEGNHTHWDYDIAGRLLKKTYADGKEENHTYDVAGRLSTTTDAKNQVKTHSYYKDGQLAGISYSNSGHATAGVSFSYDPAYPRLTQMTDGTGTTAYGYHPVDGSTFGAGKLHTIDGPLTSPTIPTIDTVAYTYDALGRIKTRSINGNDNKVDVNVYDALGRIAQLTNSLGTFNHTYDPVNLLPKTVTAPNGLATEYSYHSATGDLRLQEIKHQLAGPAALSSHAYTYSPSGNIRTWAQTTGSNPANTWGISYDRADQLEAATLTNASSAVDEWHAWRYDKIGNRISRQDGTQITSGTYNNRNQIVSEEAGGWMRVRGTTNEPSMVKVRSNTNPFTQATTSAGNEFSGWVETDPGSNTLTVVAKDTSPNATSTTRSYTINVTGTSRTPAYDLNGNMTDNGAGQTYQWDAEDRLIRITYADTSSTSFVYDGLSRRVGITERNTVNEVTSEKRYVWTGGNQPAEERDAAGTAVLKQYHDEGEYIPAATAPLNKLFYTKDHLGSVRELVDGNGVLLTRYDYDMWGKREKLSGTIESTVGYTGHHHHKTSGLVLTWYREYDPQLGRWLSVDPIGEEGGINLYGYVSADPVNQSDPLGLAPPIGGSGDNYRPDPFGHGKHPDGRPIDPHVDRISKEGNKSRYNPDGSGRNGAPKVPKKDQNAFEQALKKLKEIIDKCPKLPPGGLPSIPLPMPPRFLWDPNYFQDSGYYGGGSSC